MQFYPGNKIVIRGLITDTKTGIPLMNMVQIFNTTPSGSSLILSPLSQSITAKYCPALAPVF